MNWRFQFYIPRGGHFVTHFGQKCRAKSRVFKAGHLLLWVYGVFGDLVLKRKTAFGKCAFSFDGSITGPLQSSQSACLIRIAMNLPERRDSRTDAPESKPGIRPRPIHARDEKEAAETASATVLHFSCPACLRMISGSAGTATTTCSHCQATVLPPQLVGRKAAKTPFPAPTKTGRLK